MMNKFFSNKAYNVLAQHPQEANSTVIGTKDQWITSLAMNLEDLKKVEDWTTQYAGIFALYVINTSTMEPQTTTAAHLVESIENKANKYYASKGLKLTQPQIKSSIGTSIRMLENMRSAFGKPLPLKELVTDIISGRFGVKEPVPVTYIGKHNSVIMRTEDFLGFAGLVFFLMEARNRAFPDDPPFHPEVLTVQGVFVNEKVAPNLRDNLLKSVLMPLKGERRNRNSGTVAIPTLAPDGDIVFNHVLINSAVLKLCCDHYYWLFKTPVEENIFQNMPNDTNWVDYLNQYTDIGTPEEATATTKATLDEKPDGMPDEMPENKEKQMEPASRQRQQRRPKLKPEAILAGMDADTLWEEVLTNPNRYFACEVEGPARLTPELRTLVREGKPETAPKPDGHIVRTKRPIELETAVTHSKLAVMEWQHFLTTVDARRHPASRWLEGLLGRKLHLDRANTVDITPDRIGELPGLVAGLHRNYPDRLCVVRVVMHHKVTRYTCAERAARRLDRRGKSPLVVKTRQISPTSLHRQKFQFAEIPMLAVFPAGWMAPVTEPWMPGLFGTPYDPTLLDFCGTLPPEWWNELAKVIPAKDETRPALNIRALMP